MKPVRSPDGPNRGVHPGWILLFFIGISAIYTYPLFFLPAGWVYGTHEDISRSFHLYWCLQQNGDWLFLNRHWPQLNAPFGWNVPNTPQYLLWWTGAAWSAWFGPLTPTNFLVALSFPLSGFFAFLLARDLTGSTGGSILAGFLFAFSPWHFSKAEVYPAITSIQWIPLYGWSLLAYFRSPGWIRAFVAGAAFALVLNFSLVNAYVAGWGALMLCGVLFLFGAAGTLHVSCALGNALRLGLGHLPAFSGLIFTMALRPLPTTGVELLWRKPDPVALGLGSVGPLHFLLPTYWHPVWGERVKALYERLKPATWFVEDVVNPGYVAWGMAIVALGYMLGRRGKGDTRFWWGLTVWCFLSALFCLDPRVAGGTGLLPSAWMYPIYPAFRNFSRFALLLSLGISLMAAEGFRRMTASLGTRRRAIVLVLLLLVAGFELYCPTTPRIYDASSVPAEIAWLARQQDDGIVAEYPMVPVRYRYEPLYLTWQVLHGHRLVNRDYSWIGEDRLHRQLGNPADPAVARRLQGMGVRYMVVHEYLALRDQDPGREGKPPVRGERLPARIGPARKVFEDPYASVFEIGLPKSIKPR